MVVASKGVEDAIEEALFLSELGVGRGVTSMVLIRVPREPSLSHQHYRKIETDVAFSAGAKRWLDQM